MSKGGQVDAALALTLPLLLADAAPFAIAEEMDGSFAVTKLPTMSMCPKLVSGRKFLCRIIGSRTHECSDEVWALIRCCTDGSEVGADVVAVQGWHDGVLVSVGGSGWVGEGLGHPVAWANECCF